MACSSCGSRYPAPSTTFYLGGALSSQFTLPATRFDYSGASLSSRWRGEQFPGYTECWSVSPILLPAVWVRSRRANITTTRRALVQAWKDVNVGTPALMSSTSAINYMQACVAQAEMLMEHDDTIAPPAKRVFARLLAGYRMRRDAYSPEVLQDVCNQVAASSTYQDLVIQYGDRALALPVKPSASLF